MGKGSFGVYFDSGPTNHKHMLKIKDMLMLYTNSLRTYCCMLISQDMLISNMLIARFDCSLLQLAYRHRLQALTEAYRDLQMVIVSMWLEE